MLYIERWKLLLIALVCVLGFAYAAPNLFLSRDEGDADAQLPFYVPYRTINLGLDLRGGSYLLLQVQTDAVVRERVESLTDVVRNALREDRIRRRNLKVETQSVSFDLLDPSQVEHVRGLLQNEDPTLDIETTPEGHVRLSLRDSDLRELRHSAVSQSIEIIRRRIDETGTREPIIQRQGEDRVIVQLPGVDDPQRMKDVIGQTAKLTFHLVDTNTTAAEARQGALPPGAVILPGQDERRPGQQTEYVVQKRVIVGGESLVDAQPSFQQGQPVVSFRFDTVGAQKFGRATQQNVGKPLAIVLDGRVISAPVIRDAILGGSGIISGSFTTQQVQDLALLLRAGALPAPLTVLEERSVGPGLGADSIEAGKFASAIGLALVMVFMIICYGLFGIFSVIALVLNLVLIVALLSVLQATLTLPGIAGIVLTIGMAVDANVLIYERIREELRNGRTPVTAIDSGFRTAMSTIIDANLTTLIAAIVLFSLGSGPVKGFAVTLAIGLITSMFTAVFVTRAIVVTWLRRTRPKALPI
ncbi:MAG: protein translocase subunit SecD [Alphaproteobacteria bacterium]|nr:protein translocase subunit SecD [Alphaproteobacteria bacterium]MCB9929387.1 protein translocase subunit SecD [Alphaproteobacteria bacterium]